MLSDPGASRADMMDLCDDASRRRRLLLLEDNDLDAALVEETLERTDVSFEVTRVATRRDFVAALDDPWDLILADYYLPGFDGLAAFEMACARGVTAPFIVVSGVLGEDAAVNAMCTGIADYVLKSNLSRLVPVVQRIVKEATLLRARERALARTEARYAALLAELPGIVWSIDSGGYLERLHGRLASELSLRGAERHKVAAHPELVPPECYDRVLKTGSVSYETCIGGVPIRARMRLVDSRGQSVIGVAVDRTEQAQLIEQLAFSQRMETTGRLAAGMVHEFNNVLTVVGTHAEFAMDDAQPGSLLREDIAVISDAASRAAVMAGRILSFANRSGRQVENVEFDECVRQLRRIASRLMGERVHIVFDVRSNGDVSVDRRELDQVFLNLVLNARDAMPDGGTLRIEAERVDVSESEAQRLGLAQTSCVELRVGDSGPGVDPDVAERIFEPFVTTKRLGHGTGLGLSTARDIARRSGGWLGFESSPGRGATFKLRLPLQSSHVEVSRSLERTMSLIGGETILVVDDDPSMIKAMTRILEGGGYEVIASPSSGEALLIAERMKGPLDALIVDVSMPWMSGPELVQRVAEHRDEAAVIFTTGGEDLLRGAGNQVPTVLRKPFGRRALLSALREVLDARVSETRATPAQHVDGQGAAPGPSADA